MEREVRQCDDAGDWAAIEESIACAELPPIPPSSEPERLLRYVLQIIPRYTEMEMTSTHLRLYSTTLEQDLEQARNHARILSSELANEREKKQFLERYAAQVVKERNELLHARPSKRSKTAGHFTWHSCCKKSGEHAADLMPSMAAFRGEKLQETLTKMRSLQDEVRNQERLCQETALLLKRAQRDHDAKATADRKHIQQLEKQLSQRAILQTSTERKLFEVESILAKYDRVKDQELSTLRKSVEGANRTVEMLENQCNRYRAEQGALEVERDDLQDRLTHVMMLKDELAEQVERTMTELAHAQAEIEALHSEVRVLQSEDVTNIRSLYNQRIEALQAQWAEREHELNSQVDALRSELRKNGDILNEVNEFQDFRRSLWKQQEVFSTSSRHTQQFDAHEQHTPISNRSSFAMEHVGSSLSRSQLSNSFSLSGAHHRDHHQAPEPRTELHEDERRHQGDREDPDRCSAVDRDMHFFDPDDHSDSGSHASDIADPDDECDGEDSGLLGEMQDMLNAFEARRIEEEKKVEAAEEALSDYYKGRDEFRSIVAPFA